MMWVSPNRGKRSIGIDLGVEAGRDDVYSFESTPDGASQPVARIRCQPSRAVHWSLALAWFVDDWLPVCISINEKRRFVNL
jgi:hypothetical protein